MAISDNCIGIIDEHGGRAGELIIEVANEDRLFLNLLIAYDTDPIPLPGIYLLNASGCLFIDLPPPGEKCVHRLIYNNNQKNMRYCCWALRYILIYLMYISMNYPYPPFYPGQEPVYTSQNSNIRSMYIRAFSHSPDTLPIGKQYINKTYDSFGRMNRIKSINVGKYLNTKINIFSEKYYNSYKIENINETYIKNF